VQEIAVQRHETIPNPEKEREMLQKLVVAMMAGGILGASGVSLASGSITFPRDRNNNDRSVDAPVTIARGDAQGVFPRDNSRDRSADAPVHLALQDVLNPFPRDNSRDRSVDVPVQVATGSVDDVFPKDFSRGRSDRSVDAPLQVAIPEIYSPFPKDNSNDRSIHLAA
jgi:hypothetical protein